MFGAPDISITVSSVYRLRALPNVAVTVTEPPDVFGRYQPLISRTPAPTLIFGPAAAGVDPRPPPFCTPVVTHPAAAANVSGMAISRLPGVTPVSVTAMV